MRGRRESEGEKENGAGLEEKFRNRRNVKKVFIEGNGVEDENRGD